jgi:plastocyanin
MTLGWKRMLGTGVVTLGLLGAACSNYGGDNPTPAPASNQSASSASASGGGNFDCAGQGPGKFSLTQSGFKFDPATFSTKSCTIVDLDNKDSTTHTFTIDGSPVNVTLPGGTTNSAVLALAPGTYTFYCTIHGTPDGGGMAGTVTVT